MPFMISSYLFHVLHFFTYLFCENEWSSLAFFRRRTDVTTRSDTSSFSQNTHKLVFEQRYENLKHDTKSNTVSHPSFHIIYRKKDMWWVCDFVLRRWCNEWWNFRNRRETLFRAKMSASTSTESENSFTDLPVTIPRPRSAPAIWTAPPVIYMFNAREDTVLRYCEGSVECIGAPPHCSSASQERFVCSTHFLCSLLWILFPWLPSASPPIVRLFYLFSIRFLFSLCSLSLLHSCSC